MAPLAVRTARWTGFSSKFVATASSISSFVAGIGRRRMASSVSQRSSG
ncbi:MAG: hypothetical protein OXG81_05630 [Acidobacteria bacterium]|nr:hypothetical protein [Acidobacteriota bacterium]